MKLHLLTALLSKSGTFHAGIAGFVVATVVSFLAKWNFQLTDEQTAWLTSSVTAGVAWGLTQWASNANQQGAQHVQEALQHGAPELKIDRYLGPKTIAAAEDMMEDMPPVRIVTVKNELLSDAAKEQIRQYLNENPDVVRAIIGK